MNDNLTFSCPHCKHPYQDDMELLNTNETHEINCENCSFPFTVLVQECILCTFETTFIWEKKPAIDDVSKLCCKKCSAPYSQESEED